MGGLSLKLGLGLTPNTGGGGAPVTPLASQEYIMIMNSRTQIGTGDFPDTKTVNAQGYPCWVFQRSGYKFRLARGGNFGVGGNTSAMLLARIADVINHPCPNVIVIGPVNDPTLAESITNMTLIIQQLIDGGKRVILGNEMPHTAGNSTQQDNQIGRRNWLEDPARKATWPSIIQIDTFRPMWNAATYCDFKAGYAPDGLHPATLGNSVLGETIANAIAPYITAFSGYCDAPISALDTYDASLNPDGCLVAGFMMTGTGGRVDNVLNTGVATGWNVTTTSAGGATLAFSKGVDADGYDTQIIDITGTATAGTRSLSIAALTNQAGDLAKVLAGDRLATSGRVKQNVSTLLRGVGTGVQVNGTYGGTAANLSCYNFAGTTDSPRDHDLDLICASQIADVNAGWATGTSRIYGSLFKVDFSGGDLNANPIHIEISRAGVRKVIA